MNRFKGWIGKALVVLSILIFILMLGKIPFVQTKLADMLGKPVDWVNTKVNHSLSVATALMLGLVAVGVAGLLPIAAVALAVVAVAILAFTFWDEIFPSLSMNDSKSLGGQTDNVR